MEDIVKQQAELELNRELPNTGDLIHKCSNVIIKFELNNLFNFLESVDLELSTTGDDANKLTVLKNGMV